MNKRIRNRIVLFLTIFIIASFFFILANILLSGTSDNFRVTDLLPGVNMQQQIPLVFYLLIGCTIFGVYIGVYLAPFLFKIHTTIIGKKFSYELQEVSYPPETPRKFYSLLPAILAVSLSLLLAENEVVINFVISDEFTAGGAPIEYSYIVAFVVLLPLTSLVSFLIFTPILILLESGIIFSNREKIKNRRRSEEIRSIGSWYYQILKGYVGIGAIITFAFFISTTISAYPSLLDALPPLIILPLVPFIIMFFSIPAMILFEVLIDKRLTALRDIAVKRGFKRNIKNQIIQAEIP